MIKKLCVCVGVCLVFTLSPALHDQTGDSLLWEEEAMAAMSQSLEHQIPPMGPLEEEIEGLIAGKSGQWSVYLKNLETEEELVYNSVQMQPASVIKLFRMVALYQAAQRSELELTEELLKLAEKMITVSDNAASNEIVAALGQGSFEAGVKRVTQTAQELGCTQTQDEMMLFDYDPGFLVPGHNLTTVQDCGIILEQIYRKECVSPQYDQEMLYLLLGQTRRWKIPALLPGGARVANKTGETDDIQADVGIVFSPKCDYVICVIVNQTLDGLESQQTIAELSQLVYSYLND